LPGDTFHNEVVQAVLLAYAVYGDHLNENLGAT
jgi:hypothetical protein